MKNMDWIRNLYLLNLALLATHEIDSAYWQEWNLFHLPGGITLFLVLNLALLIAALYGVRLLYEDRRGGLWFSLAMVLVGIFAFLIHNYFLLTGAPEFRQPISVSLLGAILTVSLLQGIQTVRALREKPNLPVRKGRKGKARAARR